MRTLDAIFARALSDEHRLACTTSTISAFEGFCAHMSRLHCVVVRSRKIGTRVYEIYHACIVRDVGYSQIEEVIYGSARMCQDFKS